MPDFRIIPSIEQLRQQSVVAVLESRYGGPRTVDALRLVAGELRAAIAVAPTTVGLPVDHGAATAWIVERAARQLRTLGAGSLRPVINATGVVIHTNLGRAPLAVAALERVRQVASGYSNLEYDLAAGRRGSRTVHAEALLTQLTGAEAALVVNNNAAATLLILTSLAAGREVVVSRGELVEIGGGFRVPDIMAQSGAVLREVGTTNRTRVSDFRAVLSPRTALLLRVHPSNFRIEGFTERPALTDLVLLAREAGVPLVEDLGSGNLLPTALPFEPAIQESIAAGVDVVCVSADKLLGGPQAGLILGRRDLITRMQQHPLMRAVRVDKLTLAALEGTLLEFLSDRAPVTVPVARMLTASRDDIARRAQPVAGALTAAGWETTLVDGWSAVGGGSAPGVQLPTVLIALQRDGLTPTAIEEALRQAPVPIIARIEDDRVVLDLRTVFEEEDAVLVEEVTGISREVVDT